MHFAGGPREWARLRGGAGQRLAAMPLWLAEERRIT